MPKLSQREVADALDDVVGWERAEMREMMYADIMVDIDEETEEMRDGSYRVRRPSEYETEVEGLRDPPVF